MSTPREIRAARRLAGAQHRPFDWDDAPEDKVDDEYVGHIRPRDDDDFIEPDQVEPDETSAAAAEDRWIAERDRTASQ